LPSDVSRSAPSTLLTPPITPAIDPGSVAVGEEIARFRWERVFLSLDTMPDGTILFAAGDETRRISDWLDHARIAPWVVIASRVLRLSIAVDPGDEVTFRTPQLLANQDARLAFRRRFTAERSLVELRIESSTTGVELCADLTIAQAQSVLASLGAAVGEASQMARGAR
jgi:hypothetical protein